ncbi:MAG: YggS family pyridoxal phosphate-dependent enzyme, partial [Zhenhengia sp.]
MKEALEQIKEDIIKHAKISGRKSEDITLIAVSKTYPAEAIEEAISLGCEHFGENKVQELMNKVDVVKGNPKWHLIGHLQTNKVKYVIGHVELIHSVDSLKLAQEIEKQSAKKGVVTSILIEVNVAKEDSKHGIYMEDDLELVKAIAQLPHVKIEG